MKKIFFIFIFLFGLYTVYTPLAYSQLANSTRPGASGNISCGASGGPTIVVTAKPTRVFIILSNNSGSTIYIHLGVFTPALTAVNSYSLVTGTNLVFSIPGVWSGQIECGSSTAGALNISILEGLQ